MTKCPHTSIAGIVYENRVEFCCLHCKAKFVPTKELTAAQAETKRLQALHLNCTKRCHKALTELAAVTAERDRYRDALVAINQEAGECGSFAWIVAASSDALAGEQR